MGRFVLGLGRFGHVKNLWAVLVLGRFGIDPSSALHNQPVSGWQKYSKTNYDRKVCKLQRRETNQSERSRPFGSHKICLRQLELQRRRSAWNTRNSRGRTEAPPHGRVHHWPTSQPGQCRLNHTTQLHAISDTHNTDQVKSLIKMMSTATVVIATYTPCLKKAYSFS